MIEAIILLFIIAVLALLAVTTTEEDVKKVMLQEEIKLSVCLNRGENIEEVWTTDLSHEYITINAEYRT